MHFDLPRPCANCPFIIGTSMVLMPGRMQGIVDDLQNDYQCFPCHKTTAHGEDDDGNPIGHTGNEQACMGALAYMLRETGRLPVLARIAIALGRLTIERIEANAPAIEQPGAWPVDG